jgi:hypothetical protein
MPDNKIRKTWTAPSVLPGDLPKAIDGAWVIATAEIPPEDERGGDIVRVAGMKVPQRFPLLAQHLHCAPDGSPTVIGSVVESRDALVPWNNKAVKAKLLRFVWAKTPLADKYKALFPEHINTVSIGAMVKDFKPLGPGAEGFDYTETEIYELSVVTIPANPAATHLAAIKSALGDVLDLASVETPDDDDADDTDPDEIVLSMLRDVRDGITEIQKTFDARIEQLTTDFEKRLDEFESNFVNRAFPEQPRDDRESAPTRKPAPSFDASEARKLLDALRNANYQLSHPQPAA